MFLEYLFVFLYGCKTRKTDFVIFVPTEAQVVMKRDLAAVFLRRRRAAPAGDLTPLQLERYSYLLKSDKTDSQLLAMHKSNNHFMFCSGVKIKTQN